MSRQFESTQRCYSHLSNKETENFFLSEDENDDEFNFEYIPASRFKRLVKDVQRQRTKVWEKRKWDSFTKQQESPEHTDYLRNTFTPEKTTDFKEFQSENVDHIDRELRKLDEDAMPEMDKICKGIHHVGKLESRLKAQSVKRVSALVMKKDTDTRNSNILLAIPEEQHARITYRKSNEPKQKLVNDMRKSSSDHVIRRKHRLRELVNAIDESECNSSPKPSLIRVGDEEEEFLARPDPIIIQKIIAIQKKVSSILDEISSRLDTIPLPDGDRDLSRRVQRVAEFSVRFSRYYLYDLGRRVTDMRRHILAMSSNARPEPSRRNSIFHLHAICQKMVMAYQILLQALNAYCNHIPSSTVNGHCRKLREILQVVTDLKDMCDKINISTECYGSGDTETQPLTEEIHGKCRNILSKLQLTGWASDNGSQLMSHTTQSTIAAAPTVSRSRKKNKKKRLFSRLSMYSMGEAVQKSYFVQRPRTSIQKPKKYADKSPKFLRYNRSAPPKQPNSSPATITSLSNGITGNYTDRISPPQREDDIKTMVEMSTSTDSDRGSSVEAESTNGYFGKNSLATKSDKPRRLFPSRRLAGKQLQELKNSKKLVDDQGLTDKVTMITEERLSSLVPVIADLMSVITSKQNDFKIRPVSSSSMETLLEFLQKYQSPNSKTTKPTSPKPNRLKETRTGWKNMQLICLPYEENEDEKPCCGNLSSETNPETLEMVPEILPKELISKVVIRNGEVKNEISLISPKAAEFIIPEYHRKYQHFIQANPMYLSSTNNKPWDVVAWIADKLVGDLIADISKELEMDNIIKKMFDLEFEDY